MIVTIPFRFTSKRGGHYFSTHKESACKHLRTILTYLYTSMSCNEGVTLIMYGYPEKWLEGMTTGEGIAAELRLGIVNGHIAEGTLLTENQMAKQFNVSRSPIRDAFKLLQQNQLIQLERMGAHVLLFGEQEKKEMYDLRLMLESFAFSRVKNQERLPIVKEMKKQLEMMKVAVKFEDAESFTKHDFEFHETLIKASNHQYLNSFWSHLKPVMMALVLTSMRQRMQQNPQDFERIHHNHQVFIDAVEQYDSQILKEAFHLNFDDVGKDIEGFWLN